MDVRFWIPYQLSTFPMPRFQNSFRATAPLVPQELLFCGCSPEAMHSAIQLPFLQDRRR